jgi:hypothetical protein
MHNEPKITINGITLSISQAMILRLAICDFNTAVTEQGLGDDDIGRSIAAGYIQKSREVIKLMFTPEDTK